MSELRSQPIGSGDVAVAEHMNGAPVTAAGGRHRGGWSLGTGSGERELPHDRTARLRLLAGSAIGVGCLLVAYWLAPEQGSLLVAPSGAAGWVAMFCGIAGVWLVPGLWLSAVMMRIGAGPIAWLGTRIATTLGWYALIGPLIYEVGQGPRITTLGLFIVTTAATAAASFGVALGLSRRPAGRLPRMLLAAALGAVVAQIVIWASKMMWTDDESYVFKLPYDVAIVLGCAVLVAIGALSRPKLPAVLTARNLRVRLIAFAVIAITGVALQAIGDKWSPAQQMPSAYSAEQIPAPAGADLAFALTALGPDGAELIRRADFTASDGTGRPVPVDMRLVLADDTADRATLLLVLPRSSQTVLCGEERGEEQWIRGLRTLAPVKLTMRDKASGLILQAVVPLGWCAA